MQKGSGTLLVMLYKDAGTPATECSPTTFLKAIKGSGLMLYILPTLFGYRHYYYKRSPASFVNDMITGWL